MTLAADKSASKLWPLVARTLRFAAVGLVGTGVYFGITMGLVFAGVALQWAHLVGYVISLAVSYLGQKIFTFNVRGQHARSGARFIIATVVIASIQYGLILLLEYFALDPKAIVIASTLYYPVASYIVHTAWTFRTPAGTPADARIARDPANPS